MWQSNIFSPDTFWKSNDKFSNITNSEQLVPMLMHKILVYFFTEQFHKMMHNLKIHICNWHFNNQHFTTRCPSKHIIQTDVLLSLQSFMPQQQHSSLWGRLYEYHLTSFCYNPFSTLNGYIKRMYRYIMTSVV